MTEELADRPSGRGAAAGCDVGLTEGSAATRERGWKGDDGRSAGVSGVSDDDVTREEGSKEDT